MYDCIIVGGGPAGLSAGLVLGRCRLSVLICDAGNYRNARSQAMHGYLTRDGVPPVEFLELGRRQLRPYSTVEFRRAFVRSAVVDNGFEVEVEFEEGASSGPVTLRSRTLLLATGVIDQLPDVPGLLDFYGTSVHHCPYCDGWEWRDAPLGVLGSGASGASLAAKLTQWSRDLVLFTNGPPELSVAQRDALETLQVQVNETPIARLEGDGGRISQVCLDDGSAISRSALFITTHQVQGSSLPALLGCEDHERRTVPTSENQGADIPGLFVAGDASRDVQMVIVAAAEGAHAAFAIHKYLLRQRLPSPVC